MTTRAGTKVIVIVLAGGVGSRFGAGSPKQLIRIAGHPILHHTLRRVDETPAVDSVVVVANQDWRQAIEAVCARAIYDKPWSVVPAGVERNLSMASAVESIPDVEARVLVHDAVRPLVTPTLVTRVAEKLNEASAVVPVVPSVDPLVEVDVSGRAGAFLSRGTVLRGQSPQGFWLSDLRAAIANTGLDRLADFPTIYELIRSSVPNFDIAIVEGDLNNLKITMPVDHMIAGRLLLEDI